MPTAQDVIIYHSDKHELLCSGDWSLANLTHIKPVLDQIQAKTLSINGSQLSSMDTAGAWLLKRFQLRLEKAGAKVELKDFPQETKHLLELVDKELKAQQPLPPAPHPSFVTKAGMLAVSQYHELVTYLSFVGQLAIEALSLAFSPLRWRWNELASIIYKDGYLALPIIGLLSFLIGVVLAYQMGLQLKTYGANIYIVDLLGLSLLREFSPLMAAIMVAGRTGSSFTAQIGMMRLNQEVDALDTMGVTPGELLVLPRIVGLVIALPLLTIWADMLGVIGGMVMANSLLGISWYDFLHRFPHVIPLKTFIIGIGKAPVFALLISSIGCFQGMQVSGGAESIGRNTTRSLVLAIFFIIVADAGFSVILSKLKL